MIYFSEKIVISHEPSITIILRFARTQTRAQFCRFYLMVWCLSSPSSSSPNFQYTVSLPNHLKNILHEEKYTYIENWRPLMVLLFDRADVYTQIILIFLFCCCCSLRLIFTSSIQQIQHAGWSQTYLYTYENKMYLCINMGWIGIYFTFFLGVVLFMSVSLYY